MYIILLFIISPLPPGTYNEILASLKPSTQFVGYVEGFRLAVPCTFIKKTKRILNLNGNHVTLKLYNLSTLRQVECERYSWRSIILMDFSSFYLFF